MSVKETFLAKLAKVGYKAPDNLDVWSDSGFTKYLNILEKERETVFQKLYGERLRSGHGTKKMKEYVFRLLEAENDVRLGYIPLTMYYILTQIKIGGLEV